VAATLVKDTVTLATDPVPGYTFGCVQKATGSSIPTQGLLGLGRGPLSLLAQTQNLYRSTFSYCLPSFKTLNFSGSLRLGPVAQPKRIKFTPLLKNPRRSSLYYVNLVAVRVGRRIVDIPPEALAFNPTTGAGTIFDSSKILCIISMKNFKPLTIFFYVIIIKLINLSYIIIFNRSKIVNYENVLWAVIHYCGVVLFQSNTIIDQRFLRVCPK